MPSRAKRICSHPGCSELVDSGKCERHKGSYDRNRGSAAERGYDRRWARARVRFLADHPFCECQDCQREGKIIPSEVVDHRIPHKGDPVLFWDENNWQAMSKRCHDKKTVKEDGGFGHGKG